MAIAAAPTLWRTCRVLANRTRLRIFRLVLEQPGLTVSAVAGRLNLWLPVASNYLRALEARGFLASQRISRRVEYRIGGETAGEGAHILVQALRLGFKRREISVESAFRLATAFTHPRRIEIVRSLAAKAQRLAELRKITGMSERALLRHLRKLQDRGFIRRRVGRFGKYAVQEHADGFGRALARVATGTSRHT